MSAAWKGNTEVVDLLLANRPDLSIKDYRGMDALAFAAWENHTGVVKALLDKGAEVDARMAMAGQRSCAPRSRATQSPCSR